jgi:hypothetical protein
MRRRPCWRCGRATPLPALVDVHLPVPRRWRVLDGADRVVWLCPGCLVEVRRPRTRRAQAGGGAW